jgi:undecaprenyl-diphosphatase
MNWLRLSLKKILAGIALLSIELITVLVLFFLSLLAFGLLAYLIFNLENERLDHAVFEKTAFLVTPFTTSFMQFITFLGNHNFLIPANLILITYFLFVKRHRWYSIKVPVIAIGGVSMMFLLKQLFSRPRPLVPLLEPVSGLSFPSGHALMSVSFYGLLIFLVWENITDRFWRWTLTVLLGLIILLIGFSRIYLRLHYFSDVIAGFSAGIIWLSLSLWVIRRIERFSRRKIEPAIVESELKNPE